MQKVQINQYSSFIELAEENTCNTVYPSSVAGGFQPGDIFTDSLEEPKVALFWHQSGFAYLSGNPDEAFLNEIYDLMLNKAGNNPRRFVLELKDESVAAFFREKETLSEEPRYRFRLREDYESVWESAMKESTMKESGVQESTIPDGFVLKEIDAEILPRISGKIVPASFWSSPEEFLKNGKGYCLLKEDEVAAVAFSAAVSHKQIDIGIETSEKYRRQGLAAVVAKEMVRYATGIGKEPVWDCNKANEGSRKTAEKTGFQIVAEHSYFCKQ
ncbi:MAG: GNAT family N-acetyltransferase [Lachnospiraceae bacterium]|nr:GNAT family N-acetyltransferase [Lachnospiraceae bacterium]